MILPRVLIPILTLFSALAVADALLQLTHLRGLWEYRARVEPDYPIALLSRNGVELGEKGGYLKMVHSPFLSYRNAPNQKTPYFSTDRCGYRRTGTSEGQRIVLTGGSTAFGTGVRGDENTFASRLGLHVKARVTNAAVNGYLSGQELILIVRELLDYSPALYLSVSGFNDFNTNFRRFEHPVEDQGFEQIDDQLEDHSWLTSLNPLRRFTAVTVHLFYPEMLKRWRSWNAMAHATFEEVETSGGRYVMHMGRINRITDAYGGRFTVVLQPLRDEILNRKRLPHIIDGYRRFREVVKRGLDAKGIKWIDAAEWGELAKEEYFMDEVHFSAAGHLAVAQLLASFVSEELREISHDAPDSSRKSGVQEESCIDKFIQHLD